MLAGIQGLLDAIDGARSQICSAGQKPLDHSGGALAGREIILDFVEENLVAMMRDARAKPGSRT